MLLDKNHFFLSSSQEILEVSKPLQKLGITYFSFTRTYPLGSRLYLHSNREILDNYFRKKLYLIGNTESNPNKYKPQVIFWSTLPKQHIYEYVRSHGIDHGIFMIQPYKHYCDFYAFAAKKENDRIVNVYLNKMDEIKNFTLHFQEQAMRLIKKAEDNKIILPFHNDPLQFVDTYSSKQLIFKGEKLSRRQLECTHFIKQGKTSREIALMMNLSTRTVESYVEMIKSKIGCRNKAELIKKLIDFNL